MAHENTNLQLLLLPGSPQLLERQQLLPAGLQPRGCLHVLWVQHQGRLKVGGGILQRGASEGWV